MSTPESRSGREAPATPSAIDPRTTGASLRQALIADTDDSVSEDLMGMLESLGFQTIHSALTHEEGLAVIGSAPLDVAFIDLRLDGGLDLARHAVTRGVTVILTPSQSPPAPDDHPGMRRKGPVEGLEDVIRAIADRRR